MNISTSSAAILAENDMLRRQIDELTAENRRLRAQLAEGAAAYEELLTGALAHGELLDKFEPPATPSDQQ